MVDRPLRHAQLGPLVEVHRVDRLVAQAARLPIPRALRLMQAVPVAPQAMKKVAVVAVLVVRLERVLLVAVVARIQVLAEAVRAVVLLGAAAPQICIQVALEEITIQELEAVQEAPAIPPTELLVRLAVAVAARTVMMVLAIGLRAVLAVMAQNGIQPMVLVAAVVADLVAGLYQLLSRAVLEDCTVVELVAAGILHPAL